MYIGSHQLLLLNGVFCMGVVVGMLVTLRLIRATALRITPPRPVYKVSAPVAETPPYEEPVPFTEDDQATLTTITEMTSMHDSAEITDLEDTIIRNRWLPKSQAKREPSVNGTVVYTPSQDARREVEGPWQTEEGSLMSTSTDLELHTGDSIEETLAKMQLRVYGNILPA